MTGRSERFDFPGSQGHALAARLDLPAGRPRAFALFAHCFTCGKDILAAKRLAGALAARGIAVLRFDFTGLGHSEGEFANTHFSSNVEDLVAAADHLRAEQEAPALLVGHSLGGAAVLAAAARIPEARAVVTIGAPADPGHVVHNFAEARPEIEARGEAEVTLGGRPFRIRRAFLEDIEGQRLEQAVSGLKRALLVLHAPRDEIVGIDNAARIFVAAKHPKSFVSLDDADHLLSREADALYAAEVVAAWAGRYLPPAAAPAEEGRQGVTVSESGRGPLEQDVQAGRHRLVADEPASVGGGDAGPDPYAYLLTALGACTTMTLRMYARQKQWPLQRASVQLSHAKVHAADCADCETREGRIDRIERRVTLEGPLDEEQRARLLEIAERCPVHRTLHSEVWIDTALEPPSSDPSS